MLSMSEADLRAAIVAEARTWVGTPYGDNQRVKGAGVDCGYLLLAVYAAVGAVPDFRPDYYAPQHHLHSSDEVYLRYVLDRATESPGPPGPGDVVMFRFGRVFSHAGIVVGWPMIVHAMRLDGVTLDNVERCILGPRALDNLPRRYFTLWPEMSEDSGAREAVVIND